MELGLYWSDIKAQLGQVQEEYDPEDSVSGSREPEPTDSEEDPYWIACKCVIAKLAITSNNIYTVPDYMYAEMYHAEMNQAEMNHAEMDSAER